MKVPRYIKNNLKKQADLSIAIKHLSDQFVKWCENNKIDMDKDEYINAHGYILGDSYEKAMIEYLESLEVNE